jgi:leucyl-tRNA synthetase
MTLAPEHELVAKLLLQNRKQLLKLTLKELQNVPKENVWLMLKLFQGVFTELMNILYKEPVPVWIGDYVLAGYGTGAVMAVP